MSKSKSDPFRLIDPLKETKYATHDTPEAQDSRSQNPLWGWCLRCGMSTAVTHDRGLCIVMYSSTSAMTPICADCKDQCKDNREIYEYCKIQFRAWLGGSLEAAYSRWVVVPENHLVLKKIRKALKIQDIPV